MKIEKTFSYRELFSFDESKSLKNKNKYISYIKKNILGLKLWKVLFKKYNTNFKINNVFFKYENLPESFNNFKILFLSDLHLEIEPNAYNKFIEENIKYIDIIILGGDYFDNHKNFKIEKIEKIINKFNKPVFAVRGNHDSYDNLMEMEKLGIHVLINEIVKISKGNDNISIVGIDDIVNNDNGDQKGIMSLAKKDHFKILVSHSPDIMSLASGLSYNMQLSGHTHGGQFLFFGKALFNNTIHKKTLSGYWEDKNLKGFTSTGFGSSGYPIRNIYSEVSIITLNRL